MNETKIDLGRIARELAALLPGWTYKGPGGTDSAEFWQVLTRADGATLNLHGNQWGHKGRLCIDGGFPRTKRGEDMGTRGGRPSITADPARPVKQIAGDITRRLLPEYEPLYLDARKRTDEWDKAQDLAAERVAVLAGLIGGGRVNAEKNGVSWYHDGNGYGDATTTTGDSWTLKLHSVTWEQAQAVLKILEAQR